LNCIIGDGLVDIFILSETKLDESFPSSQFNVSNFSLYRKDRNKNGGGIMVYINSQIPHCNRSDFQNLFVQNIEGMVFELTIKQKKWLISAMYKPPNVNDADFDSCFTNVVEAKLKETCNVMTIGDLNFNMNVENKLHDACRVLGMKNIIKSSTCFKGETPTLLDVILTSNAFSITDSLNENIGISDFHHIIGCAFKAHAPIKTVKRITYRSFKNFNENDFMQDLSNVPFHACFNSDDVNDQMQMYNKMFNGVLDKHAPLKNKTIKKPPPPYMNSALRKAIFQKCMARNKFFKNRIESNWDSYKIRRNLVTKLRRISIRNYFKSKTENLSNPKDFWKIVKPFITDKNNLSNETIILREGDELLIDEEKVCNAFNHHFTTAAKNIGYDDSIPSYVSNDHLMNYISKKYENHPSICKIKQNFKNVSTFDFECTNIAEVSKVITKLDVKKAMGYDYVSPKILKISTKHVCQIIVKLINQCFDKHVFPHDLKLAEVSSIYKKKDKLNKENYRPISILVILSKVFEKIFASRMTSFLYPQFDPLLSAYREHYNCEHVLIKFTSMWKTALDNNTFFGAVLMDLSKAFDCLPHCLLIAKLKAYGFSDNACLLLCSYLQLRKQRVKISSSRSSWLTLEKGVPQGSILGPVLFNVFVHDMFYFMKSCTLLNYADDNTVVASHPDMNVLVSLLSHDSNVAVKWYIDNGMQANPCKFQAIISHRYFRNYKPILIDNTEISPQSSVKLLGVTFDIGLTFDAHVNSLCRKASQQLNVLKRFSSILSTENKLRIYKTFILSNFNYCPVIWHFCSKPKAKLIEKIQERALRFTYNDYVSNYKTLMNRARKNTVHDFRLKQIAVFVYKCLNEIGPKYLHCMFQKKQNPYNLRDSFPVTQPKVKTVSHGINSLLYHGAKIWNSLPINIKSVSTLNRFKFLLKRCNTALCDCSYCSSLYLV
jgi:hypothetical protein